MASNGTKALSPNAYEQSIQQLPRPGTMRYIGGGQWLARLGAKADDSPPWYKAHAFDAYTETIASEEPFLASAIGTVATQYSTRSYFIDGPPRVVNAVSDMLDSCDNGNGIISLFMKLIQNLKKKNNGAFLGIIREGFDYATIASVGAIERYKPAEEALKLAKSGRLGRVDTLQSLDSEACYRTANPLYPVLYRDPVSGRSLWLPWHLVVPMSELPHPSVRYGGIQLCAVARVLRAAQIMQAHETYKLEKLTGRSPDDWLLLNGINRAEVEDQLKYGEEGADNEGLLRWRDKALLFGISPEKPASGQILSSKSDGGFSDLEKELQWYITVIALGFLETYQTFAPLQAGGLGNSQQSIMLFEGAQGKGPALWEKMWAHIVKSYALIPRNCIWRWGEKSIRHETDIWTLINSQLDAMTKLKRDLELPSTLIYQIMADKDVVLNAEYLAMLGQQDGTQDVSVADDEQAPDVTDEQALITPPTLDEIIAGRVINPDASSVQAQALNGAQVSSLLEIVGMYTSGALALTSAQAIIAASFPFLSPVSINAILSKGELPASVATVEEFDGNAALKALTTLRRAYKASEAEGIVAEFSERIHSAVTGYVEGALNKRKAQNAFIAAINDAWPAIAEVGYSEGGADFAEIEEDDANDIEDAAIAQVAYATNYWDDLPDIKADSDTLPDARTGLYVQSLRGLYNKYKTLGAGNKKLTFALGSTVEHCKTCLDLNGQTHGAKWWIKHNLVPRIAGNENFECGCWNCDCRLITSEGEDFTL